MDVIYLNFKAPPLLDVSGNSNVTKNTVIIAKIVVKPFFILLSLPFRVAIKAQFIGIAEGQHSWIVSSPASSVTTQTLHGEVFVSWIYDFFTDGVS
jgi:hypothetical protein